MRLGSIAARDGERVHRSGRRAARRKPLACRILDVLVKICGLTCVEDAVACAELGADWIGLNFHRPSPRYVEPDIAAEIIAVLPAPCDGGRGLRRSAGRARWPSWRTGWACGTVQLHGQEPPEDLAALGRFRVDPRLPTPNRPEAGRSSRIT